MSKFDPQQCAVEIIIPSLMFYCGCAPYPLAWPFMGLVAVKQAKQATLVLLELCAQADRARPEEAGR